MSVRTTLSQTYDNIFGKEMVNRYMDTLFYINTNTQQYSTCYIAELILAESSARIMEHKENLLNIISVFNNFMQSFSLNTVGALGEIVAELVLLLAFDDASKKKKRSFYSLPITVEEFIQSLVGRTNSEKILNTLELKFKNGLVYFTQFIKKLDDLVYKDLRSAFLAKCAAVQLKDNHKDIDLVIPVVLEDNGIGFIVPSKSKLKIAAQIARPSLHFYEGEKVDEKKASLSKNGYLGLVIVMLEHKIRNDNDLSFRKQTQFMP